MSKPSLLALLASAPAPRPPQTAALAVYGAARAAGLVRSQREFADLVGIDRGNVYHYLAPAGRSDRVPATTATLRRWTGRLAAASGGQLRVSVAESAAGEIEVTIEQQGAEGPAGPPQRIRCAEARSFGRPGPRSREALPGHGRPCDHAAGSEGSGGTCDALVAALRGREGVTVVREALRCVVRTDRDILWIEHRAGCDEVRVWPAYGPGQDEAMRAALVAEGALREAPKGRDAAARALTCFPILVGPGADHVSPTQAARAIARFHGWDAVAATFWEGAPVRVPVTRYERNPRARAACIAHYGARCAACGLSYVEVYGPVGEGWIQVHHVTPLHMMQKGHNVDAIRDLRPICANCHSIIHRDPRRALTIEQVQALLRRRDQR